MTDSMYSKIYDKVSHIPHGRVTSYGEIARAVGMRSGAQVVGWALRILPATTDIPWQRVVNKKGQISIVNPALTKTLQKTLLEKEGVTITEKEGWYTVDRKYWWQPSM